MYVKFQEVCIDAVARLSCRLCCSATAEDTVGGFPNFVQNFTSNFVRSNLTSVLLEFNYVFNVYLWHESEISICT